jgi:sec-independent protein translocase protein TatA
MDSVAPLPLFMNLGPTELLLILLVLVLLFGAKKLPELARGSGRALRIFKSETKGLLDEDDDSTKTDAQRQIDAQSTAPGAYQTRPVSSEPIRSEPVDTPERRPDTDR